MLSAVAVAGGSGAPTPPTYALTLGSQADALGLTGVQFAAATATKNGASIAITGYAWTVTGPCTLDNAAIAQPTPTHTAAGYCTRQLAATLADGAVVYSAVDGWLVGDTGGQIKTHGVDWTAAGLAGTKTIPSSETLDGISISYGTGGGGSPTVVAGPTGLVVTPAGASSVSYDWTASDLGASALAIGDLWTLFLAFDASLAGAGDNMTLNFINGTSRVTGRFYYDSGYKLAVTMIRAGSTTEAIFTLGSHPRQIALRFDGTTAQVRYLTTAYAAPFAAFKTMTKAMSTRTSNKFTAFDPVVTDSADIPAISGATARVTVQGSARTITAHEIRWSPAS